MRLADECTCPAGPLEFERGHCSRCGHDVDPRVQRMGAVGLFPMLLDAIGRLGERERERAVKAGVDPADRAVYAAWLNAQLPPEMRLPPEKPSPAPDREEALA